MRQVVENTLSEMGHNIRARAAKKNGCGER
jgi:hypothetical protein